MLFNFEEAHAEFIKHEDYSNQLKRKRLKQYDFVTDAELELLGGKNWIIEGHVPEDSLAVVYGMPGSAKSFLALDWALHVAAGIEWNGFAVDPGPVLYIAAEGAKGYHPRIEAWKAKHEAPGSVGLRFITTALKFSDADAIQYVLTNLEAQGLRPKLVIFDTFARCFDGDENSARDAGQAMDAMDRIRVRTGAAVIAVHHSTKNDENFRGSSVIEAALDLMVRVRKTGNDVIAICKKMKDFPEFPDLSFVLTELNDSCVLEMVRPSSACTGPKLSPNDRKALAALASGPLGFTQWRLASSIAKGSFPRIRQKLIDTGLVCEGDDGLYRLVEQDTGIVDPPAQGGATADTTLLIDPPPHAAPSDKAGSSTEEVRVRHGIPDVELGDGQ